MIKSKTIFWALIAIALIIKLSLFLFIEGRSPDSKLMVDSHNYLTNASYLAKDHIFARSIGDDGSAIHYEFFRTPGYPAFLAFFHSALKIPLSGVVFLQIILLIAASFFTYQTALHVDKRIAPLSALIVLYDDPSTVYSMIILTDILFMFLMSAFMWVFVKYLKSTRVSFLVGAGLLLATATYVRPVGYFLGISVTLFMIYALWKKKDFKIIIAHMLIFLLIVYSAIGFWHYRNYKVFGENRFSSIGEATYKIEALTNYHHKYEIEKTGVSKFVYDVGVMGRSLRQLMLEPGNFKYFECRPLRSAGKLFAYPWIVFWMVGLLCGVWRGRKNTYVQFMVCMLLYFIGTTTIAITLGAGPRFRIPMVPFIAIVSAYGWTFLKGACATTRGA